MTQEMSEREARIERESVEWLFRLTGGELSDQPMVTAEGGTFRYWFEGVPDYAGKSEFPDLYDSGIEYRTIVTCALYGMPAETLVVDGQIWRRGKSWVSSGETECLHRSGAPEDETVTAEQAEDGRCPYCEEEVGEDHGHIYLGDGWAEVVYKRDRLAELRPIASAHNLQVWEDRVIGYDCSHDDCGEPRNQMPGNYFDANGAKCPHCGEPCEWEQGTDRAWFFWTCAPGCLPDSDPSGPYDSEIEALEDACEGLED